MLSRLDNDSEPSIIRARVLRLEASPAQHRSRSPILIAHDTAVMLNKRL